MRRRTRSRTVIEKTHFLAWTTLIRTNKAALIVQRAWSRFNTLDPISLERISKPFMVYRCFKPILYDAHTLSAYIRSSGDFCDPIAREPYAHHELMRLDRVCPGEEKIVEARSRLIRKRQEALILDSILTALESELRENVLQAIDLASSPQATTIFKREIMPLIVQCFDNLRSIDEVGSHRHLDAVYQMVLANVTLVDENIELRETILTLLFTLRML